MSFANYNLLNPAPLFLSMCVVRYYNMSVNMSSNGNLQNSGAGGSFYKFAMLTNKN